MQTLHYYKRNFFNTAVADIYRALSGHSYTGSFVLTFCLIDYLTWIEFGEEKYGFNNWVKKRLLPLNIFYSEKDEELYSVRNGLVHSYGPSRKIISQEFAGYELMHCNPGFHLQRVNSKILKICLYSLLTETIFAAHEMFEGFAMAGTPKQMERLDKQITILGSDPPHLFKEMHPALSCFDNSVTTSLNHIRGDYTRYILYP